MDPIVITTQEVARVQVPVQGAPEIRPKVPNPAPLWARLLLVPLTFVLPVICVAALIIGVSVRGQTPRLRQSWSSYLLTLLIISGLLWTVEVPVVMVLNRSHFWATVPDAPDVVGGVALPGLDERNGFPVLPTHKIMSGVELSSKLKPMVLLASPAAKHWFSGTESMSSLLGAAMILQTDAHGYLLATARHVADGPDWQSKHGAQKVMVSDGANGWAVAQVVGRHKQLDIALLWLERKKGTAEFRQPIATYSSVQTGEKIYVIGHPEGLNFSISDGIVSRLPGRDVLQISAPVSPGNSGGPVYDEFGNLLGVVTSKVARSMEPEAENLNFAISTDALMHDSDWEFVSGTPAPKNVLADFVRQAKVRKAPAEEAAAQ